jgi:hypothetical protein
VLHFDAEHFREMKVVKPIDFDYQAIGLGVFHKHVIDGIIVVGWVERDYDPGIVFTNSRLEDIPGILAYLVGFFNPTDIHALGGFDRIDVMQ